MLYLIERLNIRANGNQVGFNATTHQPVEQGCCSLSLYYLSILRNVSDHPFKRNCRLDDSYHTHISYRRRLTLALSCLPTDPRHNVLQRISHVLSAERLVDRRTMYEQDFGSLTS